MKKIIHFLVFCRIAVPVLAQDIQWSQPSNTLLYMNPAFTAIESQYNLGINFRDQWNVAGKTYRTYMASGDVRFKRSPLAVGAMVNSDVTAGGMYKTTNAGLTLSCLLKLGKQVRFGLGAGASYVQNSLSADVFKWGKQFNGEVYDPGMASGEAQGSISHRYMDLNAGVSFIYDKDKSSLYSNNHGRWILGYSFNHITQPNLDLNGGTDKLHVKHSGYLRGTIPLNDKMLLVPSALVNYQGPMLSITGGAMLRLILGQASKLTGNKKGTAFSVGALLRYKEALIPTIEYEKGSSVFALSYDVNISSFSTVSRFRGGPELCVRLRSIKAPPRTVGGRSARKRSPSSGRAPKRRRAINP